MEEQIAIAANYLIPIKQRLEQGDFLWAIIALLLYALLLSIRELRAVRDAQSKPTVARKPVEKTAAPSADSEPIPEQGDLEQSIETHRSEPVDIAVSDGLSKTRNKLFSGLRKLFAEKSNEKAELLDGLEELLIGSDIGVATTQELLKKFRDDTSREKLDIQTVRNELKQAVVEILHEDNDPLIIPQKVDGGPLVIVVVGVNGVGKTTTIGKLAAQFRVQGASVLIGACDTFRAAAGAQLEEWARRADATIVQGAENAKPTTVAYETIDRGKKEGFDVIIIDTAGRLHTKVNLMNELAGVVKIISRELPGSPHETLLVLDASTGQNAVQQAREFNDKVDLTGVVVTKLDGTPKGGVIVAIKNELKTPIRYIGVGEGLGDLRPFSAEEFVDALFDDSSLIEGGIDNSLSAHAEVRTRRKRVATS